MSENLFYSLSPLLVLLFSSLFLFASAVVGYLVGRFASQRIVEKTQIGSVQVSIIGLLALMLGFTFAVALSRFDTRRNLAIDEANALGTTFLRAQMLPEPYKTNTSKLLRDYIDLHLEIPKIIDNPDKIMDARRKAEAQQSLIWKQAIGAAEKKPTVITSLFISSLNESFDLYSSRIASFYARVPGTILWTLVVIAIIALGIVGYGFGIAGQRSWLVMMLTSILVSLVIVMIVDLDRPEAGPTRISQQAMVDLRNSLSGFEK